MLRLRLSGVISLPWRLDIWFLRLSVLCEIKTRRLIVNRLSYSASYPSRDGKWVVATGWRPSVADWGNGMFVFCTAGPVVRYRGQWMAAWCAAVGSIISSCQSAATSKIVKVLLVTSLTHVSSAIAGTRPLPLPLLTRNFVCGLTQKHCAVHATCRRGCSRSCSGSATATAWWIPSSIRAPVATSSALFSASCDVVIVVMEFDQARQLLQLSSARFITGRTMRCRLPSPVVLHTVYISLLILI